MTWSRHLAGKIQPGAAVPQDFRIDLLKGIYLRRRGAAKAKMPRWRGKGYKNLRSKRISEGFVSPGDY
jgi:hypothetical protein